MQLFLKNRHVREESLELQVMGDLTEGEAATVNQHVRGCHQCSNREAGIAGLIRMLRSLSSRMQCYGSSVTRHSAASL